jgi:hypothetical protein
MIHNASAPDVNQPEVTGVEGVVSRTSNKKCQIGIGVSLLATSYGSQICWSTARVLSQQQRRDPRNVFQSAITEMSLL